MKTALLLTLGMALLVLGQTTDDVAAQDKAKPDFSTPKAAVQTFISAATNRDVDLLSRCFHDKAAREFDKVREKKASKQDLDKLADLMRGGEVTGVKTKDDKAAVDVKLKTRKETIDLGKTADGWKIIDF